MLFSNVKLKRLAQIVVLGIILATSAMAQQVVKVGTTPTGPPFNFLDTKTNTLQGIMVDLCNEIGKRSGLTMEIEPVVWSALIPSLTTKKIDMIAAAMYITDKRKEVIDFSNPIYTYGEGLIVQKTNTKDFVAFSDMKGFTVGAQVGTAYIDPLKTAFGEDKVRIYDGSMDGVLGDIATGRLDAGFLDYPQVAYALTKGAFPNVRLVKSYKSILTGSVGIGVRKGDKELVTKINSGLAAIQADGTLKKILAKWGID